MSVYIRATGNISPQKTFGHPPFLEEPVVYYGNRLKCIEPDYRMFIDVKQIRRMSRIIKMGVASAMECLQEAGVAMPGAIVTGTAFGCLEDTGTFLERMVEQQEELLPPTAFIQSTHNTVGAQVALMLNCNAYNNVFVHRAFSFESALLDGMLLIKENEADNVLVGGLDEITDASHRILSRFGLYRRKPLSNMDLFNSQERGSIAGEGAAFFLLCSQSSANDYARLDGIHTFYKASGIAETTAQVSSFLQAHSVSPGDIDLVILGRNGNTKEDSVYDALMESLFLNTGTVNYKHLCGEYPTSVSFALWLAVKIIRTGTMPVFLDPGTSRKMPPRKILIYNHSQHIHHSLLLISAC